MLENVHPVEGPPPAPRGPRPRARRPLEQDEPCRRCGYNLRGLPPQAECPECALPVARSLAGDGLRSSDPAWIGRLALGSWIAAFSYLAPVAGFLAMAAGPSAPAVATLVQVALAAALAAGAWLVTAPDPGGIAAEPLLSARRLARWCTWGQLAAVLIGFSLSAAGAAPGIAVPPFVLTGLIGLTGAVATVVHVGHLARRIPNPGLARQAIPVACGFAAAHGILLAAAFLSLVPAAPRLTPPVMLATRPALLAAVVFGIWAASLFISCARAMQRISGRSPPGGAADHASPLRTPIEIDEDDPSILEAIEVGDPAQMGRMGRRMLLASICGIAASLLIPPLAAITAFMGFSLVAGREPGAAGEPGLSARRLARWSFPVLAVLLGAWLLKCRVADGDWLSSSYGSLCMRTWRAAFGAGTFLFLVGSVAGLTYLRGLADRIDRPGIAAQLKLVAGCCIITCALAMGFAAVEPPVDGLGDAIAMVLLAALGMAVYGMWGLVLVGILGAELGAAARRSGR